VTPTGLFPTGTVEITVLVVVLIIETLLFFSFGIYAYSADKSFCAVTTDSVDEKIIKNKKRAVEAEINECALSPPFHLCCIPSN
jgi:hypothetical protein